MKIAVIGTGSMGKNHMRVLHSLPQYELCCAVDINPQTLREACEIYPAISACHDYKDIADQVEAVAIATPTIHHYEIARYFLAHKKHVMIEKPISNTLEQADELIALADQNNVCLAVGHLERFNPAVEYIRPLVKQPLFIEVQRLGSFSSRSLDIDVIMDLMVHDLDIILQWDKSGIQQINAAGVPIISAKTDIANVHIQFNSKLVANITASRVSQHKTRKLRIFQKNNYISLDYKKRRVKMFTLVDGTLNENIPVIEDIEPLRTLWENFHKTITSGTNYNVTGSDGRQALELALRISNLIIKNNEAFS